MAQQIAALTEALTRAEMDRLSSKTAYGDAGSKKRIDGRHLRDQDFNGNLEDWGDWAFAFKRSIRAQSKEAFVLMGKVEALEDELDDLDLPAEEEKLSGEIYDSLFQTCKGEALSVIRKVDDCNGARAWQKSCWARSRLQGRSQTRRRSR